MIGEKLSHGIPKCRSFLLVAVMSFFSTVLEPKAATYTVSNISDSGPGSLRQAMIDANANPGLDTIVFSIAGGGARTISPQSLLPTLTDPVILDGGSQPGYQGKPLIELNGLSAGAQAPGLRLTGGNSIIRGLVISRFSGDGIRLEGEGTNTVQGNYIGTDLQGLVARGNSLEGIFVYNCPGNLIGGRNAGEGNVICASGDAGIYLLNSGDNRILGNLIGVNAAGSGPIPNGNNGTAVNNSPANAIGGTGTGSRNVISGNKGSGIYIIGAAGSDNRVQGNFIGTDASGSRAVTNQADGVTIVGSPRTLIGGTNTGAGNVISGNGKAGIFVSGLASAGTEILGNYIGCDAPGTGTLGNSLSGIVLMGCRRVAIGGLSPVARNVIYGNKQDGVLVTTNAAENFILGNYLGLDSSGLRNIGNGSNGVTLNNATLNQVGGKEPGAGNVISGNSLYGVLGTSTASSNSVQGNLIGLNASGAAAVPNRYSGVRLDGPGNSIIDANVISGNGDDGVIIVGSAATNNLVAENFIGTDRTGSLALANGRAGVGLSDTKQNVIGLPGGGNVISGNGDAGVYLMGATFQNRLEGNKIGTDRTGNSALPNTYEGVYMHGAKSNWIGSPAMGAGNQIAGGKTWGLILTNASSWNVIQGNLVGTKADGISPLGNRFHGIDFWGSDHNVVGGTGAGNVFAFAQGIYSGVRVRKDSFANLISANAIFSNGALGIDLGDYLVLANDACDADTGANLQQNYPILQDAWVGSTTSIRGTLNSTANRPFVVQFFSNPSCDSSGNGEGQVYLGEQSVITDANCSAVFSFTVQAAIPPGSFITATARDADNNTSEFSPCVQAQPIPGLTVQSMGPTQVLITWPAEAPGFVLYQTENLAPPVEWTRVQSSPSLAGGRYAVTVPVSTATMYFLLKLQ